MRVDCEQAKRLDLVSFLQQRYGCTFRRQGAGWACCSPLTSEEHPSLHVRLAPDGHWLFKDFSSGAAGTIIDFVQIKEEIPGVADALAWIQHWQTDVTDGQRSRSAPAGSQRDPAPGTRYDLPVLYRCIRRNDAAASARYLHSRGIVSTLIHTLIRREELLRNHYRGKSYCCFAVRNTAGELTCLDNRQIGGKAKFVLGHKSPFSLELPLLPAAPRLFVCEGIIDYLSIKTLHPDWSLPGLAMLGREPAVIPTALVARCTEMIVAVDDDPGGRQAAAALRRRFPQCSLIPYDLGGCRDPNELLHAEMTARAGNTTPEAARPFAPGANVNGIQ